MEFHVVLALASNRVSHMSLVLYLSIFSVPLNSPNPSNFLLNLGGKRILHTLSSDITMHLILEFWNSGLLIL